MASSSNPSDILSTYTNDIARHPLLDITRERELGHRALGGDEEAQEELVRANLRFVITIAKRYRHHGVPLMDLIQAGNIGLTHAAKKFDPSVGVRFISYAVFWISQQIQKEIDANNGAVRDTPTQMVRLRRIRRLQAESKQRLGRDLTMEELKHETGYTEARITDALSYRVTIKSLDEPVNPSDGASTTLAQVIGFDDGREDVEQNNETVSTVHDVLSKILSDRERQVLAEYYGFGGKRELSLTEIGQMRGISRERARQLKERAQRKIKAAVAHHPALREVFRTRDEMAARGVRLATADHPMDTGRDDDAEGDMDAYEEEPMISFTPDREELVLTMPDAAPAAKGKSKGKSKGKAKVRASAAQANIL